MAAQGNGAEEALTFVISVAAELAGMHPQTLRQYDRLGLVIPARAKGRGRRYSKRDIQRLRDVQRMSQEEGINLAGIQRILELERSVERLEEENLALKERLAELMERRDRVFAATPSGEVLPVRRGERSWAPKRSSSGRGELALWRPFRPPFHFRPEQRVRAVIEAGPAGVRVIEGSVAVID